MLIFTAILMMLIFYIFMRPILFAFGASEATYVYASQYLVIYLLGTIFTMVSSGMNAFINAQGFSRVGMATTVVGAVANFYFWIAFGSERSGHCHSHQPIFKFSLGYAVFNRKTANVHDSKKIYACQ